MVLAEQIPDARVTTVDIDTAMASLAAAAWPVRASTTGCTSASATSPPSPWPDHSVDLVTSSFSVHHWPHAEAGFAEVRRVLRPGGRAIVYDVPDWWGRFETHAPRLADAAMAGGFRDVSSSQVRWPRAIAVIHRIEATN